MENPKKKNQNRSYYLKNKEKILERARIRAQDPSIGSPQVVSLYDQGDIPSPDGSFTKRSSHSSFFGSIEAVLLLLLVVLMTSFLIHETSRFFLVVDGSKNSAYFKALLLEGAAVAFSIMSESSVFTKLINRTMVVLIYGFGIWAVSGPILDLAYRQGREVQIHQQVVQELEQEVAKKEAVRDQYWKQDRVTWARKIDLSLESLKLQLSEERSNSMEFSDSRMIKLNLIASVWFRVLIMVSNFCFIRRLSLSIRHVEKKVP